MNATDVCPGSVAVTVKVPGVLVVNTVVAPPVGGSFGFKNFGHPEEYLVCVLSRLLGRPVKWVEDRASTLCYGARDSRIQYAASFDADGRVTAVSCDLLANHGAASATGGAAAGASAGTVGLEHDRRHDEASDRSRDDVAGEGTAPDDTAAREHDAAVTTSGEHTEGEPGNGEPGDGEYRDRGHGEGGHSDRDEAAADHTGDDERAPEQSGVRTVADKLMGR